MDDSSCSPRAAERAFSKLEGRWKLAILYHLFVKEPRRFSDLARALPGISERMLTVRLRELERDGIVAQLRYPEVPPRVEYRLTPFGRALREPLHALLDWASRSEP